MSTKVLLIDDNMFVIDLLSELIEQHHPHLELLGFANNGTDGVKKIEHLQPDLIFLDIEMPDMNGFDMLAKLKTISFQTIFITSHSQYAIKAIRFNALDYLMKPIDETELAYAIRRYNSKSKILSNKDQVENALINLQTKKVEDQKLLLHTQKGTLCLALKQILKIEGDRNYSYIHLSNNNKELISKTLGYFEDILSEKGFFRCHRSFLVNSYHVDGIQNKDFFLLKDKSMVPISRRKKNGASKWYMNLIEKEKDVQ